MAIHAPITGEHLLVTPVQALLSRFDRASLAIFIETAIDLLDVTDGDPDLEPDGDELDGSGAEDDFLPRAGKHLGYDGADAIFDPDQEDGHDAEQVNEDGVGHLSPQLPRYGTDQSRGPINEAEAYRAWQFKGQRRSY